MTGSDPIRDWFREALEGRVEVDLRELADECERSGVVDDEFRRLAVVDQLHAGFRHTFSTDVDEDGVRRWINRTVIDPAGGPARQVYKQEAFFDADDYRIELIAYEKQIVRLVGRYNALAKRAKEKAGVEARQLKLAVARPRKAKAS